MIGRAYQRDGFQAFLTKTGSVPTAVGTWQVSRLTNPAQPENGYNIVNIVTDGMVNDALATRHKLYRRWALVDDESFG